MLEKLRIILIRILLYLVLLLIGTLVIRFVVEAVGIAIPPLQTYLGCPQGTTVKYDWVQESWDEPGTKTMVRSCVDSDGKAREPLADEVYSRRQSELFTLPSFVIMLVAEAAWVIVRAVKGKKPARKRRKGSEGPDKPEGS